MQDYGKVSIITASWNCADFIGETIESITAQTYKNWELLITDDCSTDNSREVIAEYTKRDSRIKLFKLKKIQVRESLEITQSSMLQGAISHSVTVMTAGCQINSSDK